MTNQALIPSDGKFIKITTPIMRLNIRCNIINSIKLSPNHPIKLANSMQCSQDSILDVDSSNHREILHKTL